ncbi:MAG: TonB family protein [Acidobacteria bacterium]|nr:TonB family protein [Acidobacteriota bacterium]
MIECNRCRKVYDERSGACPFCGGPAYPGDGPAGSPPDEAPSRPARTLLFEGMPGASGEDDPSQGRTVVCPVIPRSDPGPVDPSKGKTLMYPTIPPAVPANDDPSRGKTLVYPTIPPASDPTPSKTLVFPTIPRSAPSPPPHPDWDGVSPPPARPDYPEAPPSAYSTSPSPVYPAVPSPETYGGYEAPPVYEPPGGYEAPGGYETRVAGTPSPAPPSRRGAGPALWVGLGVLVLAGVGVAAVFLLRGGESQPPVQNTTAAATAPAVSSAGAAEDPLAGVRAGAPEPATSAGADSPYLPGTPPEPGTVSVQPPVARTSPPKRAGVSPRPSPEPSPDSRHGQPSEPPPGEGRTGRDRPPEIGAPPDYRPSDGPMRVAANALSARLVHRVDPSYPEIARRNRIQGIVILKVLVDKKGGVKDITVLRGHPLLDGAAKDAVRKWRYEPFEVGGERVPVEGTVIVNFQLR